MHQATYHFPAGFLWGTATASHQVEGNNTNNNWWAWEQEPGRILKGHKSGLACDWWGANGSPRWKEDFDRAAQSYQNAHRLSIEWSRVQPAPDRWDEHALDRYRDMMRGLLERGLTPVVTLHHFTDPLWLTEKGGWETPEVVALFAAYVQKVVEALKEYVNLWVTINEPNVYVYLGYGGGGFPPGKKSLTLGFRVIENMVRAHAAAYRIIHRMQPEARVGVATHYRGFQAVHSWSPLDRGLVRVLRANFNNQFADALSGGKFWALNRRVRVPEAAGTQDFLGINYYTRTQVAFNPLDLEKMLGWRNFRQGVELSDTGMIANEPEGLFEALKWGLRYKVPMIVSENGIDNADDRVRPSYLLQHIHQIWRAVNFNFPVKGYFHWSLVDNFEWGQGWTQRFGLWQLDETTQARRKRPSVDLFAEICRENGISSDMVTKYAPQVLDLLFPGF